MRALAHGSKTEYEHENGWVGLVGLALEPRVAERGQRTDGKTQSKDGAH